jgi:membrane fusion protein, multidrug efflux system
MKTTFHIGSLAVITLFLFSCSNREQAVTNKPQEFPITEVSRKDTVLFHEYVTDIHAVRHVEVRARVQGYLDHIYIDEGKPVKAGQLLFKINDQEYKSKVAEARASVNSSLADVHAAVLEVERVNLLVQKNVVSETELKLAKAKAEMTQAKLEESRSNLSHAMLYLSHTDIRAPFDGFIDRIPFKIGSLISEGHLLTTLFDTQSIHAYFKVSEKDYLEYVRSHPDDRSSNTVELILADGSLHKQTGIIETMEGEFDTSTGTIAFRARFPNEQNILKHGSSGKIRLSNRIEDALLVPQKATFEIQDKTFVFLVDNSNKAVMKSFVPKVRMSHYYLVESGLNAGDRIVYEGIQNIRDGMLVQPSRINADTLLAKTVLTKAKKIS